MLHSPFTRKNAPKRWKGSFKLFLLLFDQRDSPPLLQFPSLKRFHCFSFFFFLFSFFFFLFSFFFFLFSFFFFLFPFLFLTPFHSERSPQSLRTLQLPSYPPPPRIPPPMSFLQTSLWPPLNRIPSSKLLPYRPPKTRIKICWSSLLPQLKSWGTFSKRRGGS